MMSKILLKSLLITPAFMGAFLAMSSPGISAEATKTADEATQTQTLVSDISESQVSATTSQVSVSSLQPATTEQKLAQALPAQNTDASEASTLNQINQYVREGRSSRDQVTSVSQFSDVKPTDWAYQALKSLVERYGCIVGYPDKTYRGNRALTRWEFAAGLNACLDKIQELIAAATADFVRKEDLETVKKLQEEFAAELAALRGRVDALEVRTATLEKQQFSTTTKLSGEAIFAITDEFAQPGRNEAVFQDRVRLTLSSSFSGKDKLIVRLAAGNANLFNEFDLAGNRVGPLTEGSQTFNTNSGGNNSVSVDWAAYYFPIGENIQVYVPATGGLLYDLAPTSAGYLEDYDGGNGALSIFAQRNPIYGIGSGAGAGITFGAGKPLSLTAMYLSSTANNPNEGQGLFNGSYSALGQLTFAPNDQFSVSLTYVNAFQKGVDDNNVFTGGVFNGGGPALIGVRNTTNFLGIGLTGPQGVSVNAGGLSAVYKFSSSFAINGWVSYFRLDGLRDRQDPIDAWSYALGLSFPDFGKKGNLLGLFAGVPPYRTDVGEIPIHVEGLYRIRLNDNISVTPGVIWVINQGQRSDKDALIGTLRTTFTF
uniref:iron uptake porin n=1 Tax=Leptodesmis sichuanensis TaxID=2906798 RepID=UPI001F453369|nr:iron uptake porin [Leptodesmis sichuanensis]